LETEEFHCITGEQFKWFKTFKQFKSLKNRTARRSFFQEPEKRFANV
jgi:hypothetical protein